MLGQRAYFTSLITVNLQRSGESQVLCARGSKFLFPSLGSSFSKQQAFPAHLLARIALFMVRRRSSRNHTKEPCSKTCGLCSLTVLQSVVQSLSCPFFARAAVATRALEPADLLSCRAVQPALSASPVPLPNRLLTACAGLRHLRLLFSQDSNLKLFLFAGLVTVLSRPSAHFLVGHSYCSAAAGRGNKNSGSF